jgi:nitrite reductase/ring-hydroxylating ferredoxin subunit
MEDDSKVTNVECRMSNKEFRMTKGKIVSGER